VKKMVVEILTKNAFLPFGEVIELDSAGGMLVNAGTAMSRRDLARVDVGAEGGRTSVNFMRASPQTMPIRVSALERHPLGSQAFLPLGDQPFMIVVAAPGPFDVKTLRAFVTRGRQGINYGKGVWHHALICLGEESQFIVVDRAGEGLNFNEVTLEQPLLVEYPESTP
jgi:ureidoglycolate lyase